MSATQCCSTEDVRGMCFTCVGDLGKMTGEAILKVRKCPRLEYAIGWWIWNNHGDEEYYKERGVWADEFQKNEYLALLNPDWDWVNEAIYEIVCDKECEEEEDEDENS
jgi:hypothetical protein